MQKHFDTNNVKAMIKSWHDAWRECKQQQASSFWSNAYLLNKAKLQPVSKSEKSFVFLQDRFYEIDRTWKNNLVFNGIKGDSNGYSESQDCLENKIRTVLRNKLNIGREIVINRCQRIYNGHGPGDGISRSGASRPVVVNFFVIFLVFLIFNRSNPENLSLRILTEMGWQGGHFAQI